MILRGGSEAFYSNQAIAACIHQGLEQAGLPAAVVQETGRQLLEALSALEAVGVVHGEILSDNVIVDRAGRAILVDAGIRPALQPQFSFSSTIEPSSKT